MAKNVTIEDVNRCGEHINGLIGMFKPSGKLNDAVKDINQKIWWYQRRFVHKDTGSLFKAIEKNDENFRGYVFVNKSAVNSRHPKGTRPATYIFYENARGGDHAIIDRSHEFAIKEMNSKISELTRNMANA